MIADNDDSEKTTVSVLTTKMITSNGNVGTTSTEETKLETTAETIKGLLCEKLYGFIKFFVLLNKTRFFICSINTIPM